MSYSGMDTAAFMEAAASGEIGIDPDAAQAVLSKIRAGKDAVESLISRTAEVGVLPQLGANPVGEAMSAKYADRASGYGDSYLQALRNLHAQYEQVEQAINAAIRNYDEMESATAASLNRQL
ncbi:hypothetical protein [Haloechinothrix sp. LS1_15]|uniref:hypothetical protein n=1 Tax=Haloechinothrix sp. LS1_15 TaxID=2652248 RepID=UPI0029444903|nr:hypothetical protein [Haloechinothrix sp. LS1_15]MDV6011418.1 hypothetical protein [Haloechinothrix sp. LS1_15]